MRCPNRILRDLDIVVLRFKNDVVWQDPESLIAA
jgi:hypothetical protein